MIEKHYKNYVIFGALAQYASIKTQLRYLVHATKDRYMVANEVIYDFDPNSLEAKIIKLLQLNVITETGAEKIRIFSKFLHQQHALVDWCTPAFLKNGYNQALFQEYLVFHDPAWDRIRRAARLLLEELNFDLEKWEVENIKDPLPQDSPYLKLIQDYHRPDDKLT